MRPSCIFEFGPKPYHVGIPTFLNDEKNHFGRLESKMMICQ
ncbi:hypothetical protein LEP1GSC051_3691 [Leptospira sp. P2653]|nr:hypothetical protein LEP1GSC051_3691 [Leptospira sp. P2653]